MCDLCNNCLFSILCFFLWTLVMRVIEDLNNWQWAKYGCLGNFYCWILWMKMIQKVEWEKVKGSRNPSVASEGFSFLALAKRPSSLLVLNFFSLSQGENLALTTCEQTHTNTKRHNTRWSYLPYDKCVNCTGTVFIQTFFHWWK